MPSRDTIAIVALLVTLVIAGVSSIIPSEYCWGMNYLKFLPVSWWITVILSLVGCALLLINKSFVFKGADAANLIFSESPWYRVALALICGTCFFLFRSNSHLLGDGYTLIANLGQGETYYGRSTEFLSIYLIRWLQRLLGGYDRQTATLALQILSCASGAIAVYSFAVISSHLSKVALSRVFVFITLIGSGALLLFFGYVEFYPLLWAAGSWYFAAALRYLQTGQGRWQVLLALAVALGMHLEAVVLLPGTAVLFLRSRASWITWKRLLLAMSAAGIVAMMLILYLCQTRLDFAIIFLPLFTGRPRSPDYALLSVKHLVDLANLLMFVFPGALALIALWLQRRPHFVNNSMSKFLFVSMTSSIVFLLMIDPALGMARDWDLFSFTLLPAILFLTYHIAGIAPIVSGRLVAAYSIVCISLSALVLASNAWAIDPSPRINSLLEYYGRKDRSGWVVLGNFLSDDGRVWKAQDVLRRWQELFPEDQELKRATSLISTGDFPGALQIGLQLVRTDSFRWEFHDLVGFSYGQLRQFEQSEKHLKTALMLSPYMPSLRHDLAQLYLDWGRWDDAKQEFRSLHRSDRRLTSATEGLGRVFLNLDQLDSASAIADTLFQSDPNSPGGHLLALLIAVQKGDQRNAAQHYAKFANHGKDRSDYLGVMEFYSYLSSPPGMP